MLYLPNEHSCSVITLVISEFHTSLHLLDTYGLRLSFDSPFFYLVLLL